jgi:hypothetical protein
LQPVYREVDLQWLPLAVASGYSDPKQSDRIVKAEQVF